MAATKSCRSVASTRASTRASIFRRNQEEGSVNECGCSKSRNPKRFLYDVAFRKRALLFGTGDYWAPGGPIVQDQFSVYDVRPKRPRRSGLCLRLLRSLALPAVMDWQPLGVAVTTCVLQVSGRFSRLRLILQYSCLSAMSAPRSLTPPHACCTACLHACALHRCLPSPDAACAIERPPTSSPMLACLGSVLTPSACLPHRPRRRV